MRSTLKSVTESIRSTLKSVTESIRWQNTKARVCVDRVDTRVSAVASVSVRVQVIVEMDTNIQRVGIPVTAVVGSRVIRAALVAATAERGNG